MSGNPCGTAPSSFTPRASRPSRPEATIPPTTTNNATGLFLRKIFPSTSTARAAIPIVSEVMLVSRRCWRK